MSPEYSLHANSGDADEDSARDFSRILKHINQYLRPLCDCILWVHHSGHGNSNHSRGTTSRPAAADVVWKIERNKAKSTVRFTCVNMKDASEPAPMAFLYRQVDVGVDNEGAPVQSLVLQPTKYEVETPRPNKRQLIMLDVLREAGGSMNKPQLQEAFLDRVEKIEKKEFSGDNRRQINSRITKELVTLGLIVCDSIKSEVRLSENDDITGVLE